MNYYIGAHITKNKTILNTLEIIKQNNCNVLQLFVSNPRSGRISNIDKYIEEAPEIINYCLINKIKIVIHSSYTINLAKELKIDKREILMEDCYWIDIILNELYISDLINSIGCIVHVGKYTNLKPEDGLNNMKKAIKYIIDIMKERNIKSRLIIETPAGQGTELLTNIDEFLDFYNSFSHDEKKYIGICIDTAHVWSAGYDLEEVYKKMYKRNKKDILVIHLNNSKKEKKSLVDIHEELDKGKIKYDDIINFIKNIKNKPIYVLEKPSNNLIEEIKNLNYYILDDEKK